MDLKLKAIKYCEFASEETFCFRANLYLNNKPFAVISNDGRGGCDRVIYHDKFVGDFHKTLKNIENYFKTLPKIVCEIFPSGFEQSLECWCAEEISKHIDTMVLNKLLKANILYKNDGKIFQFNKKKYTALQIINHINKEFPDAIILNNIDKAEALRLWMEV